MMAEGKSLGEIKAVLRQSEYQSWPAARNGSIRISKPLIARSRNERLFVSWRRHSLTISSCRRTPASRSSCNDPKRSGLVAETLQPLFSYAELALRFDQKTAVGNFAERNRARDIHRLAEVLDHDSQPVFGD